MATRSTIALEFADGTIGQVYAHWDGYLAHNGKILFENYSDPFKLRELIDLGSVCSLAEEIGEEHMDIPGLIRSPIDEVSKAKYSKMCTFFGRDRGEDECEATYFNDYLHFLVDGQAEEYDYILRNIDGVATWFVSDHGGDYMLLTEAFAKEAETEVA